MLIILGFFLSFNTLEIVGGIENFLIYNQALYVFGGFIITWFSFTIIDQLMNILGLTVYPTIFQTVILASVFILTSASNIAKLFIISMELKKNPLSKANERRINFASVLFNAISASLIILFIN